MKQYIDGIKDNKCKWNKYIRFSGEMFYGHTNSGLGYNIFYDIHHNLPKGKRIPITYYKRLDSLVVFGRTSDYHILNTDNLKWIDGQPYELIVLNGKV